MYKKKRFINKSLCIFLTFAVMMTMLFAFSSFAVAATTASISYAFSGSNYNTAGYAQGTITLSSTNTNTYHLYWANNTSALNGFYEIAALNVSAGGSASYSFGEHTAIPAGATKIIATTSTSSKSVANANAVYDIPASKQLGSGAGNLLYKFNSYSDVHIDVGGYYKNAEANWGKALKFGVDKGTDFIVTSGDMVTNASGPDSEWNRYERILADSDYVNPVWESDGNHDMRTGIDTGIKSFVRNSGTDSTIANYDANKPYYYMVEKNTGDVFIFMALENVYKSSEGEPFSSAQISWLTSLLNRYYNSGVNVYIVEHAPINNYGAGDRMSNPYYKAHLNPSADSTKQFKALLEKYPKLIWMSGHTHEDLEMNYNYSNQNGTSCNMIHNPSVAGTTWASGSDTALNYDYNGTGLGKNTQGYYVEAYQNEVIFYGANLADENIYPAYCYIMEGSRAKTPVQDNTVQTTTAQIPSQTVAVTTIPTTTTPVTSYSKGDVNRDNIINIKDATLIQKCIAEYVQFTDEQIYLADVDGNCDVTINDVTQIQKFIAELITEFTASTYSSPKTVSSVGANTFAQELVYVKTVLEADYTFSSYDQYQSLKKLYYRYKNSTSVSNESEVVAEFEALVSALDNIAQHIGAPPVYNIGDTYYFENTYDWSDVYCYAWTGTNENAAWPGVKMQKVGTNYGHDVYGIKFASVGQYVNVIFNNGSAQTVDITLSSYDKNCFYLDGTYTDGNLNVGNFDFTSSIEPTAATTSTSDNTRYALCYYNSTYHGWSTIDTFLQPQSDGTYALDFVTKNSDDISLNIYNNSNSSYNCVAESTALTYSSGNTTSYSLSNSSSRGKSITISGLSSGLTIKFVYNPTSNTLKITCGSSTVSEPTETTSSSVTYNLYMAPASAAVSSGDVFKANIKDSGGSYHSYTFEKTSVTYNGVPVYKLAITDPTYTNVIKIQYQSWTSGGTFDGQVVDERTTTLSYYNNKIMVCSSKTSGSLTSYSM